MQILIARQPPKLERLGNVFAHGLLDLVHFLARFQKSLGHRIIHEQVALVLEIQNLVIIQGHAHLLFVLKRFALFHDELILRLRSLIIHEVVDSIPNLLELRLFRECLAKFPRLLKHRRLSRGRHAP